MGMKAVKNPIMPMPPLPPGIWTAKVKYEPLAGLDSEGWCPYRAIPSKIKAWDPGSFLFLLGSGMLLASIGSKKYYKKYPSAPLIGITAGLFGLQKLVNPDF
tara:strand:+ start:2100 stop:2405 length:306 start_codon:yes stop_codon:yes gene_type:complete